MQKYLDITESFACILKIFVVTFLLSKNFLISFGINATQNLRIKICCHITYKATQ